LILQWKNSGKSAKQI